MIQPVTLDVWVRRSRVVPHARLRLFCFPYAGGGASAYRTWPEGLPRSVEVCPVQPPGRENRMAEAPFTRLTDLVAAATQALASYLDRPFALYGHSMGGQVAYEFARRVRRDYGLSPVHLFVGACPAPHLPRPTKVRYTLPDPMFAAELRRFNGVPEELLQNRDMLDLFLPLLRADFAVFETHRYTPDAPLNCPISAFAGSEDPGIGLAAVEGWAAHTTGGFTLRIIPGGHFFLRSHVRPLLQALSADLEVALRRPMMDERHT